MHDDTADPNDVATLFAEITTIKEQRNDLFRLLAACQTDARELRLKLDPLRAPTPHPEIPGVKTKLREWQGVHRQISAILDAYPATAWDLAESQLILTTLSEIVRRRQQRAEVVDLGARRAVTVAETESLGTDGGPAAS